MFRSELERAGGWQRVALALPGERVVGYLLCRLFYDVWHVLNIAVAPDHRRRGVAAALMEEFLEWAKVSKLSVTLEVRPSNEAALALYKKLAFFREGVRRGYYADTGEDALIMTWSPWAGLSREPGTNKEAENGE